MRMDFDMIRLGVRSTALFAYARPGKSITCSLWSAKPYVLNNDRIMNKPHGLADEEPAEVETMWNETRTEHEKPGRSPGKFILDPPPQHQLPTRQLTRQP